MSEYFYRDTKESFPYIRLPKALLTDERYRTLSSDARFLYAILYDRMCLSRINGWFDDSGRVFIIFTVRELMDTMGCADRKIKRMMDELEKADLLERKRLGQGKPNMLYVKTFESSEQRIKNLQNDDSGIVIGTVQDSAKQRCSNTDITNTDNNYTENNQSIVSVDDQTGSERDRYCEIIKGNIEYDTLLQRDYRSKVDLDEIVEIMLDTVCSKKEYIRVGGDDKPREVVKGQLLRLRSDHIEYCMECLKENATDVRNIRQYLLTTLYNAPMTISHYYESKVHHDMAYDDFGAVRCG